MFRLTSPAKLLFFGVERTAMRFFVVFIRFLHIRHIHLFLAPPRISHVDVLISSYARLNTSTHTNKKNDKQLDP